MGKIPNALRGTWRLDYPPLSPAGCAQEFKTKKAQDVADDALRARLAAKKEIDQQHVERTGQGTAAIDGMLRNHINRSVAG